MSTWIRVLGRTQLVLVSAVLYLIGQTFMMWTLPDLGPELFQLQITTSWTTFEALQSQWTGTMGPVSRSLRTGLCVSVVVRTVSLHLVNQPNRSAVEQMANNLATAMARFYRRLRRKCHSSPPLNATRKPRGLGRFFRNPFHL